MTFEIHLLGSPRVVRDGKAAPAPRGNKVWGLLAYLLLREAPATRAHVADLLFPAAEDPLAALRWNLSMLRRLVGDAGAFVGDPLSSTWAEPPVVDVLALRSAGPDRATEDGDLGQDLLGPMAFPGCPAFEIWLEAERRHARGAAESLLHEAALARLARGDADASADLAGRLVTLNPYDENFQTLLVRSLAVGGHGVQAARQAAACRELFSRELGVDPGPSLDAAVLTSTAASTASPVTGRPAVQALLEAGKAAIGSGALEAGLQVLRRAVTDAATVGDDALTARAFGVLGSALVHSQRGSDEEGATALHQALTFARAEPATLAEALVELAHVEFLHGRYDRVEGWVVRADGLTTDPGHRAAGLSVRGATLSDLGRYPAALQALGEGLDLAQGDRRRSWTLSMIGRVHLLRGHLDAAVDALDESTARALGAGWTAFVPWPESLRAEVDLQRGDLAAAQDRLEHAFALSCRISDPCWEGLSARGLGLVRAAQGDADGAIDLLVDARRRASRLPDAYVWVAAYVLDALATVGVARHLPQTGSWVAELADVAERSGMAELSFRAAAHRWRLGDPAAREAARALGASVDNPLLAGLLEEEPGPVPVSPG